jgi:DNA-binding MarR family transcriptional regulator
MNADYPNPSQMSEVCACLGLNRAARGTTRRYDAAFKPLGITSGQFTVLVALKRPAPAPLGKLAAALGMDRTTLNRNVRLLEKAGLVETVADGEDARVRRLALTASGDAKLQAAIPCWQGVQLQTQARLPGEPWAEFCGRLAALA